MGVETKHSRIVAPATPAVPHDTIPPFVFPAVRGRKITADFDGGRLTMPKHLRGTFKRVDYLVGVPGTGIAAFDVKAKTVHQDALGVWSRGVVTLS